MANVLERAGRRRALPTTSSSDDSRGDHPVSVDARRTPPDSAGEAGGAQSRAFVLDRKGNTATPEFKKLAWAEALERCGVPFAPKGSATYERAMKIYTEETLPKHQPPVFQLWAEACKYLTGAPWVSRASVHYERTRELYEWMKAQLGQYPPLDPLDFARFEREHPRA